MSSTVIGGLMGNILTLIGQLFWLHFLLLSIFFSSEKNQYIRVTDFIQPLPLLPNCSRFSRHLPHPHVSPGHCHHGLCVTQQRQVAPHHHPISHPPDKEHFHHHVHGLVSYHCLGKTGSSGKSFQAARQYLQTNHLHDHLFHHCQLFQVRMLCLICILGSP